MPPPTYKRVAYFKCLWYICSKTLVALACATYHFDTYFLEIWHDLTLGWVRLCYVTLFHAKISIIFGINTSNNAGLSKMYAEKQVALYSLTFTTNFSLAILSSTYCSLPNWSSLEPSLDWCMWQSLTLFIHLGGPHFPVLGKGLDRGTQTHQFLVGYEKVGDQHIDN